MKDFEEVSDTTIPIDYTYTLYKDDTLLVKILEYPNLELYIEIKNDTYKPTVKMINNNQEIPYMFQHELYVRDICNMVIDEVMRAALSKKQKGD